MGSAPLPTRSSPDPPGASEAVSRDRMGASVGAITGALDSTVPTDLDSFLRGSVFTGFLDASGGVHQVIRYMP